MHARWLGATWEEDAKLTKRAIDKWGNVGWLVVDHYALDDRWEASLRPATRGLMVIDDLADRSHDCDLLLDQNYYDDLETRYNGLVPETCRKLLGPAYALLRPEFARTRAHLVERSGSVRRILVFFGGSDPGNQTQEAIDALLSLGRDDIDADVIVGAMNPRRNEIERLCSSYACLHFHCQISNMAELMASADMGIGGGGVALLARCVLALPTIILSLADNQLSGSRALAGRGGALYLGPASNISTAQMAKAIEVMLLAPEFVRHMAVVAGQITDGRGSDRVAASMLEGSISLRRATADDCEAVWQWRNDASIRLFSGNASAIDIQEHRYWFDSVLRDPDRALLIAEDEDGAIGVLRYDIATQTATVSVYLVPGRAGRNLGTRLIREGEEWLKAHRPELRRIRAEISAGNESSIRAFAKAGFVPDRLVYVRNLGVV